MADGWICVAQFGAPHGVAGQIKLTAFTETPEAVADLVPLHRGAEGPALDIAFGRPVKGGFQVRVAGFDSREAVGALSGQKLFVPRDRLPAADEEDSYYLADLIGLAAVAPDGRVLGRVKAMPDYGAGTLVELALDEPVPDLGRSVLLPFEARYVPAIRLADRQMVVDLDGWLGDQIEGAQR